LKKDARGSPDVIVFFTMRKSELARRLEQLAQRLGSTGALWIAWPKKSSGIETDLAQNDVMDIGLAACGGDLVDNKVCAIDERWSGLRFVIRKERRAGWPHGARSRR
jgi:hypothetical protein